MNPECTIHPLPYYHYYYHAHVVVMWVRCIIEEGGKHVDFEEEVAGGE